VFDICCDKAGDVWIASNGQGILHIRTADGTWRQYTRDNGMISDHVYCLQADDTGCIWAGTFADGLAVRIPSEGSFKAVSAFPNLENKGIGNIARDEKSVSTIGSLVWWGCVRLPVNIISPFDPPKAMRP